MFRFILVLVAFTCACESTEIEKKTTSVVEEDPCQGEKLCDIDDFDDASFPTIEIVVKLDCESVDAKQNGDICVSVCSECAAGFQCIDTNGNWFPDTCVAPVKSTTPTREPPPVEVQCGGTTGPIGIPCSGAFGACAENGVVECVEAKWTCSTDVGGSQSLATFEVCDGKDNDCNGVTDNGTECEACPGGPTMPYYQDMDEDGYGNASVSKIQCSGIPTVGWSDIAGDCDDKDPYTYPGKKCAFVGKNGETKLSVSYPIPVAGDYANDDVTIFVKKTLKEELVGGTWSASYAFKPENGFAEIAINPLDKFVRFNTISAPGWWSSCGGAFANGDMKYALNPNMKVYLLKDGIWKDVTEKLIVYEQLNDVSKSDSQFMCSALLKL